MERTGIFISYSREDERWVNIVRPYFKPLEKTHNVDPWDDTRIKPGKCWRNEIEGALERAKIAILLVTQSFITSDFISNQELPTIFRAARERGLIIFWIAVRPSDYKGSPIEEFQAAHNPNKPLSSLLPVSKRDRVLVEIANGLKQAIESVGGHAVERAQPVGLTTPGAPKNESLIVSERIKDAIESQSKILDLSSLSLSELPASVCRATSIQTLKLENNRLTHLPEDLDRLSELRELLVRNNRLESLPKRLGELKLLRRLDLGLNRLITVPQSISRLTQLEQLGLRANGLRTLSSSFGELYRLKYLYLGDNRLYTLPDCFKRLSKLEKLSLRDNGLKRLPDTLELLANLTMLDVSGNELTSLPKSIGRLARLEKLHLRDNSLIELPDSLGKLERLRMIDLSGNNLTSLPKTLVSRISLIELNLSPNGSSLANSA